MTVETTLSSRKTKIRYKVIMKLSKDIDENLALFEVTQRNCAATDEGDLVEFHGFIEDQGRIYFGHLLCSQVDARQHVDYPTNPNMFFPAGMPWRYDITSVRPLTKLARKVMKDMKQARKEEDK